MRGQEYQPVNHPEAPSKAFPAPPSATPSWREYVRMKAEAAVWVAIFLYTFHKSQFVKQLLTNPRVTQPFLTLFSVCLGVNLSVTIFILYLTYARGIRDYESYSPNITPFAAVSGLIGFLSLLVAVFPVYGFLSFVVVPALTFGLFMFSAFIPFKGELNVFCLFGLMGFLAYAGLHWY